MTILRVSFYLSMIPIFMSFFLLSSSQLGPFGDTVLFPGAIIAPSEARVLLEGANEAACRDVMTLAVALLVELLENLLGEDLAQLDTPLVERVDVPDGTLGEGEVLVVNDQGTELSGTDVSTDEYGGGGAVAEEDLVRDELLGRVALGADLVGRLADHEGLSLCEVVRREHLLVQVVRDGVVRLGSQDEVGGDELGTLVDELEEGVLGVGAGLAE